MASNTKNLNLLMKNPSTDGADTFNVQTMLNENWQKIDNNAGTVAQTLANILKPTTPPIIGLPPSATPNDMFNVLAHAGDLHVWRKTITSGTGTYSLGAVQEDLHYIKWANNSATSDSSGTFEYGSEIAVNNDGTITGIKNPSTITIKPWDDDASKANVFKGKFIKMIAQVVTGLSRFEIGEIWWIPADAVMTKDLLNGQSNAWYIAASKRQQVIGVPAGTTVTYPVSTNRNAYQEGNDAKPAGYTLGEAVTGDFILGQANASSAYLFYKASSPTVSDDGTIEFDKNQYIQIGYAENWTASTLQAAIRGQFLQRGNSMNVPPSYVPAGTIYIPNDAVVTRSNDNYIVSKYQPVTSYAAIPANTTIEYLGCLGDKARVQVVSYVGTGTYGADNPNSLTFYFVPKIIFWVGGFSAGFRTYAFPAKLSTDYSQKDAIGSGANGYRYTKVSNDKKTIMWYHTTSSVYQLNSSESLYAVIAIG